MVGEQSFHIIVSLLTISTPMNNRKPLTLLWMNNELSSHRCHENHIYICLEVGKGCQKKKIPDG
jgi:hypothetical protein